MMLMVLILLLSPFCMHATTASKTVCSTEQPAAKEENATVTIINKNDNRHTINLTDPTDCRNLHGAALRARMFNLNPDALLSNLTTFSEPKLRSFFNGMNDCAATTFLCRLHAHVASGDTVRAAFLQQRPTLAPFMISYLKEAEKRHESAHTLLRLKSRIKEIFGNPDPKRFLECRR